MAEAPNGPAQPGAKGNGSRKVAVATTSKPAFIPWSISLLARLATWAAILTILFRCPPTLQDCDESSPFVCKHYFRVKNAVTPHAKPYYDRYAAPYVDVARPYYDTVKTNVIAPVGHYAVHYGEPWAVKGRDYALARWEVNGQPRIAQLQALSQAQYDKTLAPHVAKAVALAAPYYDAAKMQSLYAVDSILYPAYEFSKPYAISGYETCHKFALTTVLPAAQWTWSNTNAFLDRAVWPQLRVVYVKSVEPQLVRIGERLGRYKSHAKNKTLHESGTLAAGSSSTTASQSSYVSKPTPQNTGTDAANAEPSDEPAHSEAQVRVESNRNPVEAPEPEEDETDKIRKIREMVANDLESWQEKFAAQAEQGAAEIEDSIDDISRRMIDDEANVVGVALTQQLQDTIKTEIANLKEKINVLVSRHLEGAEVDVHDETIQAVRAAGIVIKSKAQAIRSWREQYDEDLQSTVMSTSDVHFAILDETRSLALQQIGMKWAWTDGITYKDWAKYHELKSTLSDWTDDLKQLIVTHPTLLEAQDAAVQVEDRGMAIAAAAAKELASLKEVVQWKIDAEDVADEFDADRLKAIVVERARLAEEARLKAEEEARLKAEEEARMKAEEDARIKAEEEARASQDAGDEDEDVRIHSMKESIESKPLISVDADVEYTEEDERMRSVREAATSHPLISEAVPEATEETEEPSEAVPEETPADADDEDEEKPATPKGNRVHAQAANGSPKHTQPVQPPNAVDR